MSTKFRQSFTRLYDGCRPSSKSHRSSATLFCKEYAMRPMLMSVNRDGIGGTMSTTGRSYHQSNMSQLQDKRMLLVDNTPTPVTAPAIDTSKFIFP
jgi:hypothetical protein